LYVASVVAANKPHPSAVELPGKSVNPQKRADGTDAQTVSFVGDDAHLLSASGDMVTVWDLSQFDRLATVQRSLLPPPCYGCVGALAAVSPDGGEVAAENGGLTVVQALEGRHAPYVLKGEFGPPVWDGRRLLPLVGSSRPTGLPSSIRVWKAVPQNESIAAAALKP